MSFLAQRTAHFNASRSSPYDAGNDQYTDFHYTIPNYYPPAQDAFAVEWNLAASPDFPGAPDFAGGNSIFPEAFVAYDTAASAESIPCPETPPSTPSSDSGNASTERPKRASRRGPDHIPRPRNAFMIFRSELCASGKISKKVEGDNRHISITAAAVWKAFSDEEKKPYHIMAELEKLEHRRMYPNYRFTPTVRATKPLKRKVHRNGAKDIERSRQVAQLILAGKAGDELEEAVRTLDEGAPAMEFIASHPPPPPAPSPVHRSPEVRGWVPHDGLPETVPIPDIIPPQDIAAPTPHKVLLPLNDQYAPNYSAALPSGWDYRYTGKRRDPMASLRRPSSPPRVLVELYENVVDRPMVSMVATV